MLCVIAPDIDMEMSVVPEILVLLVLAVFLLPNVDQYTRWIRFYSLIRNLPPYKGIGAMPPIPSAEAYIKE